MTNEEWQKLLDAKDREIAFLKARIADLEKRFGLDSCNHLCK